MNRAGKLLWLWLLIVVACLGTAVAEPSGDDYSDNDNGARVARITVARGDAQIRRADSRDWEQVAPNLPLVEGDRIATGEDARLEIQFDNRNYLRVAENTLLQIVTLRDAGVALSVPEGSISLRLARFDREREYFEIDAPKTTVAARKAGLYRVDAPREGDVPDVLVTVTGDGEARIYSEDAGFTIRNGRTARIFTAGDYAGEYEMRAAPSVWDDFDRWAAERDDKIAARRARDASAYYDPDVYGADELSDYGEWIYTDRYGYVWRPYRSAIASYNDWTPYRYGHWRYLSGYGWTWVADESWGWATSHYGRWVYVNGGWSWCPYDSWRRHRRWQPALVVFATVGRSVCWYPLPYHYGYTYVNNRRKIVYNTTVIKNTTVVVNNPPVAQPTPGATPNPAGGPVIRDIKALPEYAGAVTRVSVDDFGKNKPTASQPAPLEVSRGVIAKLPTTTEQQLPIEVRRSNASVEKTREIVARREGFVKAERELETGKIGAAPRDKGNALDRRLERERVNDGRTPVFQSEERRGGGFKRGDSPQTENPIGESPRTSVFDRRERNPIYRQGGDGSADGDSNDRPQRRAKSDDGDPMIRPPKRERSDDNVYRVPPISRSDDESRRPKETAEPRRERSYPRPEAPVRNEPPPEPPRYDPPQRREEPPRREEPRNEPPPQREERRSAPPKEEPREQPAKTETRNSEKGREP